MTNIDFYQKLKSFKNFNELTEDSHFSAAPTDWSVVITDVRGSTAAIAEGRYKEVNTIGAASIVVTRKAMKKKDFPFVFGGDGATFLISPDRLEEVLDDLCALKALANKNFKLDLRVGMVKISELYEANLKVEVAKYEIVKGRNIAFLRGSGVSMAEKKIKQEAEKYEVKRDTQQEADLDGLSCRWQPIPSKKGKILSLLVQARKNDAQTYQKFLAELNKILPGGLDASNPINLEVMNYKTIKQTLKDEMKLHKSGFSLSYILRFLEIIGSVLVFKIGVPPLFFSPKRYSNSMRAHSDFKKFDDILRMVIDCSSGQIESIKKHLQKLYEEGDVFFGLFETDNSLMTCYVDGLNDGEHIHFIDADNGGYAAAAVQLKQQMKLKP